MPTDSRVTTVYAPLLRYYIRNGVTYTQSNNAPVTFGSNEDSRTYVLARRRPVGFVNPNPYTRIISGGNKHRMYCNQRGGSGSSWYVCNMFEVAGRQIGVPSFDGTLQNRAILDARLKVKDQTVNFAVGLAESGRTSQMLLSSARKIEGAGFKLGNAFFDLKGVADSVAAKATTLAKSAIAVRKGNFLQAAKLLGVTLPSKLPARSRRGRQNRNKLAENWLEFQYGWKPLMSDMFGAVEHLAKRNTENPNRYGCTVKSRKGARQVASLAVQTLGYGGHPVLFKDRQVSEHSAFVRLDYRLKHSNMAELASTGATNPLEVAWELVPFSFVIDWFAPIGKFLGLLDSDSGWDFMAGSVTTRLEAKNTMTCSNGNGSGWFSLSVSGYGTRYYKAVNRSVFGSSPIPDFFFKNPVSNTHIANATALIATAFGSRYR